MKEYEPQFPSNCHSLLETEVHAGSKKGERQLADIRRQLTEADLNGEENENYIDNNIVCRMLQDSRD